MYLSVPSPAAASAFSTAGPFETIQSTITRPVSGILRCGWWSVCCFALARSHDPELGRLARTWLWLACSAVACPEIVAACQLCLTPVPESNRWRSARAQRLPVDKGCCWSFWLRDPRSLFAPHILAGYQICMGLVFARCCTRRCSELWKLSIVCVPDAFP